MSKTLRFALLAVPCAVLVLAVNAHASVALVPEIDPGTASGGLALVTGSVLLLLERLRRR